MLSARAHVWTCGCLILLLVAGWRLAKPVSVPTGVARVPPAEHQEIVYIHYGELQDYQALGALHALRSNPTAKITVILDRNDDQLAWQELAADTNLSVYRPTDYAVVDRFRSVYRHASVNSFEKEVFCVYRHLLLHQYMMQNKITSVVYLDLDIVVFNDNLFQLLPPDSTISPIGTFAIHWTQQSLSAFAKYIWHFYERSPSEIARQIAAIGKVNSELHGQLAESELIGGWWPEGIPRHHISDMRLFRHFVNTTGALQILCRANKVDANCPRALHLVRNAKQNPMINVIKFDQHRTAVRQFRDAFTWIKHSNYGYSLPVLQDPVYGTSAVPGMHFQGQCKRVMPEVLCPNVADYFPNQATLSRICTPAVLKASST